MDGSWSFGVCFCLYTFDFVIEGSFMIKVENLSKQFRVYKSKGAMIKGAFGLARQGKDYDLVTSLKGVSLNVAQGEIHGIIGVNGAGKSTLLKILVGVMDASSGSFKV